VTVTKSKVRWWTCSKCGGLNPRTKQKCAWMPAAIACTGTRPKRRVPVHARTLRDDTYEVYLDVAREVHGVDDESCCCCGKPRSQERRHDRDHGHLQGSVSFGRPRGVLCVPCNRLMPRELTPERSRLITAYLDRVETYYAAE
jgi:Recombination endonuclease VII